MAIVKSDVDILNDSNWEGSFVAILAAFIVENGQLMQYLQGHGISANVLMALMTVVIQRLWVYLRAGRQIAETRLQTKMAQMAEDAKAQARAVQTPDHRNYP